MKMKKRLKMQHIKGSTYYKLFKRYELFSLPLTPWIAAWPCPIRGHESAIKAIIAIETGASMAELSNSAGL